jgi:hypothetical protein
MRPFPTRLLFGIMISFLALQVYGRVSPSDSAELVAGRQLLRQRYHDLARVMLRV